MNVLDIYEGGEYNINYYQIVKTKVLHIVMLTLKKNIQNST